MHSKECRPQQNSHTLKNFTELYTVDYIHNRQTKNESIEQNVDERNPDSY